MINLKNLSTEILILIFEHLDSDVTQLSFGLTCQNLFNLYQQDHKKRYIFSYLDQLTVEELQDILQNHELFQKTYHELLTIQQKETTELNKTTELINTASENIVAALIIALDSMFKDCLQANIQALTENNQKKAQALIKSDSTHLAPAFCVSAGPVLWHAICDDRYHLTDEDLFKLCNKHSFWMNAKDSKDHNKINFLTQFPWGKKRVLSTIRKDNLLLYDLMTYDKQESNIQFILKDKDYRSVILSLPHAGDVLCEAVMSNHSINMLLFMLQDKQYLYKIKVSGATVVPLFITGIIQTHKPSASIICYLLNHPIVQRWLCTFDGISDHLLNILEVCPDKKVLICLLENKAYQQALFSKDRNISNLKDIISQARIVFSAKEQENITAGLDAVPAMSLQKFLLSLTVTEEISQGLKRSA